MTHAADATLPASFLRRMAAMVYDALLLLAVLFAATFVALTVRGGQAFAAHDFWFSAYLVLVSFFFYGWFWTHGGQTLGMRTWRIRVVLTGSDDPIGWRRAFIRFMGAGLSFASLGIGFLWMLLDPGKRSWHDLMSGTRIIVTGGPQTQG